MSAPNDATTVADLVALIDRTKKSLTEAGRQDLAELCCAVVRADGEVSLRFSKDTSKRGSDPTVLKALSIDPEFRAPS